MEIVSGTQRGPHTILVPCSWDHCPLPFPVENTMFGHTHRGLGSSVCFLWAFITLSGLWLRPGLELPKLQINLVIHPGLFGFRAGRLWHQPELPWWGSLRQWMGAQSLLGALPAKHGALGALGAQLEVPWGWIWVFGSSRCAPVHTCPHFS